ncbi:MAG: efflux RND transporter permease subunit [Pontiellaceae bacterium]|nr:efflux RND transporter permease subunit [Pontiellaceae bacterium]MBN2785657.1 efflux RND transporter permease subunit [Pontiellaceae bacterium]
MNDLSRRKTVAGGAIAWMASNPVAANVLMVILFFGGLLMALHIKQEFLPTAEIDVVSVKVLYPGASPEEVEQGILLAAEEAVRGIDGVKKVYAGAYEGVGTVAVQVLSSYDSYQVANDVRNQIDRITTFPQDAEKPIIEVELMTPTVLDLIVAADLPPGELRELGERIREALLTHPGITRLHLNNVREHEIAIEIPQETLRTYGITLQQVAMMISRNSVELAGGGMRTDQGEILVRVNDRRDFGPEFFDIPIISYPDGTEVKLGEIATISDAFDESDKATFFNEKPALSITVYRVGNQTPLTVEEAVKEVVEKQRSLLPDGVDINLQNNQATMYRDRMQLLLENGIYGLILVFLLLGAFLELRLAFWVMLGIPISFLGTFLFMPMADVSLNMITMFAFLIALGIVVDDAIVVGENIYYYHQDGMPFLKAAAIGAKEIAGPVTFSVLTNIVAFLPLCFVPGVMGKFFKHIPVVVCTTFAISLIESIFILPAHLAHQSNRNKTGRLHRAQQKFSHAFIRFVRNIYAPILDKVLTHRYITFSAGLVILILTLGMLISGRMGWELFPNVDAGVVGCDYTLPYGAPVADTMAVRERIIASAKRTAELIEQETGRQVLKNIFSQVGAGGGHAGNVYCELDYTEDCPVSSKEFETRWRKENGEIAGLKTIRFISSFGGPGGNPNDITLEISHSDMETLQTACTELAEALGDYNGMVHDIDDGFTPGKPQIDLKVNAAGRSLGLTSGDIARQVRNSYYGSEAIRQQRGRNEIKVKVRLPEAERDTEYSLEEMVVLTPAGTEVPLREVVQEHRGRAYTSIHRRNGLRTLSVTANVTPSDQTGRILKILEDELLPELMKKYDGLSYAYDGRQADQIESVTGLMKGLVVALLCIYALLAIPFKSYLQPLIIMVSIPFGIVGAAIGHYIMGYSFCLLSLFGVVALSGVVINDALVFIDYANRRRRDGLNMHDAIISAGVQRFRPIILTTLTTFFGLTPMIFETSLQARFLIPMAISLGFGILFATGITLLLIPALTMIIEDISRPFQKKTEDDALTTE